MGSNLARLYEDALQGLAKLPLSQFAVLKIEGPDSRAWLQGQLTQDVRALHPVQRSDRLSKQRPGQPDS